MDLETETEETIMIDLEEIKDLMINALIVERVAIGQMNAKNPEEMERIGEVIDFLTKKSQDQDPDQDQDQILTQNRIDTMIITKGLFIREKRRSPSSSRSKSNEKMNKVEKKEI